MVYKFKYPNFNGSYIWETSRHIKSRIEEHTRNDNMSQVYKHLHENEACFTSYNDEYFSILDSAKTKFQLRLKDVYWMCIGWENPELNQTCLIDFGYLVSL